ncbi:major facilitator superfamily transporter [Tritrichomonas foetus]|uniref:Major facilitator superfamily transporter n=1 Tax=Tritrichomonas foetus TaxID=1144522 RepID=A0A1J4L0C8_9EUKA|nr:major facilitator superfamily transporter [Tritrichomonas foetus]|eukprot:OHT16959.1 major facilitator superfamily transporter [Tritrichomonas foetus]
MGLCGKELLYSFVLMFGAFTFGYVMSYPALALLDMEDKGMVDSKSTAATFFNSITALCAIFGTFVSAFLLKFFGRKPTTAIIACFGTFSWSLLLTLRKEYFWFGIVVRGLCGLTIGAFSSIIPMYIVELAPAGASGFFGSLNQLGIATGIVIVYLVGNWADWRWTAVGGMFFTVFLSIAVWFIPESPAVTNGNANSNDQPKGNIMQKQYALPLFVCVMLMVFQQFCGINAILTNLADLFKTAGVNIEAGIASAISGSAQVISVFIGAVLVDKLGRRLCWCLSFGGMVISMGLYATSLKVEMPSWLPIVIVFLYLLAFGLGAGAIPWFIVSEMFDTSVRPIAQSIVSASNWILAFTVMTVFPYMREALTDFWCFILFTAFSVGGIIFGMFYVGDPKPAADATPLITDA